jgi:hypothetical protein
MLHHFENMARRELVDPTLKKHLLCQSTSRKTMLILVYEVFLTGWRMPVIVCSLPVAVLARANEWRHPVSVKLMTGRAPVIFRLVCGAFEP